MDNEAKVVVAGAVLAFIILLIVFLAFKDVLFVPDPTFMPR